VYQFIRDLVINLLKIAWNILGLFAILLFFVFLWGFGRELADAGHSVFGWSLQIVGIVGILLFLFAFLASFSKTSPTSGEINKPKKHSYADLWC
jgi:hypothetical protein